MILDHIDIDADEFYALTDWKINPEGACNGETCVPLPSDEFDLTGTAGLLGMALVHDAQHDLWALGPASLGGRALSTAEAPELVLSELDGGEFRLSSLRGQKVVLVAWAPY